MRKKKGELPPKQREMLEEIGSGGCPGDQIAEYGNSTLWFRNRERVLGALQRKGLLDTNLEITDAGMVAIGRGAEVAK